MIVIFLSALPLWPVGSQQQTDGVIWWTTLKKKIIYYGICCACKYLKPHHIQLFLTTVLKTKTIYLFIFHFRSLPAFDSDAVVFNNSLTKNIFLQIDTFRVTRDAPVHCATRGQTCAPSPGSVFGAQTRMFAAWNCRLTLITNVEPNFQLIVFVFWDITY